MVMASTMCGTLGGEGAAQFSAGQTARHRLFGRLDLFLVLSSQAIQSRPLETLCGLGKVQYSCLFNPGVQ